MSYNPTFSDSIATEDKIRYFVADLFKTSDDASRNNEWVDYFVPDAVLVMGDMTAKGTAEIRAVRQKMWEKVRARKHRPEKVFGGSFGSPQGGDGGKKEEYMFFGGLEYEMKTGEKQEVSWASHAVLVHVEDSLKFEYYRVYIQR